MAGILNVSKRTVVAKDVAFARTRQVAGKRQGTAGSSRLTRAATPLERGTI